MFWWAYVWQYIRQHLNTCRSVVTMSPFHLLLIAASPSGRDANIQSEEVHWTEWTKVSQQGEPNYCLWRMNSLVLLSYQTDESLWILGVSIDRALSFSDHITLLCQKAGEYRNVLSGLSNELTTETKLLLFRSFILSHFNYCSLIWHFCGLGDLEKMEKVQLRLLHFVCNDFHASYSDLRSRAGGLCYTLNA